ncbi:MAG TPA: serine hydrolase domain-containing protein [Thermoanaerobaculia bacterium]|nr:serine hydrolase domain-containing protein [Thermoanaerobaculia bacterium]
MRRLLPLFLFLLATPLFADDTLPASVDKAVAEILAKTGAPSASVAVVRDGKLAYTNAYGFAKLESKTPATPAMRYSIGSISKQFTASAILMLAEEGKLSLDDRVGRWLPELTRAKDVTIRELLSMTSGYQDFWPQDYVMPGMLEPATARQIADTWAKKPLDFEPGTKWQYSNTNYVIAGMIAERAAGMPLIDFLRRRVFTPLQMTSVFDTDAAALPAGEPERYLRYALGPLRPAPKEGKGWMFAAGELAMTAQDLAKWDISMINESVLKPASYRELERETLLTSGAGAHYGLGVSVNTVDGRRVISHGGEVSGFTAQNSVYPDQRAAVVVLTNLDATSASEQIATKIAQLLFASTDPSADAATAQARKIFEGLQKGEIDRALFTSNANAYFSEQALKDFASSLGPLGTPQEFTQVAQSLRGGMTLRRYRVKFANKTVRAWTFAMPDGKLEQFMAAAVE